MNDFVTLLSLVHSNELDIIYILLCFAWTGSQYHKVAGLACDEVGIEPLTDNSLDEALEKCDENVDCQAVYDAGCNEPGKLYSCATTAYSTSSENSCVYNKRKWFIYK